MRWQNKLTKEERRHLKEDGNIRTKADMVATRKGQKALDPTKEVCRDCQRIAVKLGIEQAK